MMALCPFVQYKFQSILGNFRSPASQITSFGLDSITEDNAKHSSSKYSYSVLSGL